MQVYMFTSQTDRNVVGLVGDKAGDGLPAHLAPWRFRGSTCVPEDDPRLEAATVRAAISRGLGCLVPVESFP
jgi:hypothetical protein